MGHYAFLDENNVVTEVITGRDENELGIDWEEYYGKLRNQICKRTSYNTLGGKHRFNGEPYRKNYAGQGYFYDQTLDAFIPPKPYPSWILNTQSCLWEPPIPAPSSFHVWDENTLTWKEHDPIA